jgi:peptidoglycan/LPS O-acetylase OafA/YrhL
MAAPSAPQAPPQIGWDPYSPPAAASATQARDLKYLPALDGLRAAAVLAVMLYHGGVTWMRGGYLGVDAFFVLSGFLITSLLLREWNGTRGIAFLSFWARRARRLLPALGLVVLGVILYAAFLAPAFQLSSLRSDTLATLGYATNWRLIFSGQGYFTQFAAPSPLRHMWSLAIEEQFYLVWPLVVYVLCRWARLSWRAMATLFLALAVVSAVWMGVLFGEAGITRVYYGTDTRAQALLIGAALAVVFVAKGQAVGRAVRGALLWTALAGAGVTAWLWVTAGDSATWLYQGGCFLAAIAVAAVIAGVIQRRRGVLGEALSLPPVRWIGRISYGLYLWHWPLFVVLTQERTGLSGFPLLALRFAATFAIATLSYYAVEMPVRNGALKGWRSFVVVPTAVGALAGAILLVTSGAKPVIAAGDTDRAALADVHAANRAAARALAESRAAAAAAPVRVLVVGDSVGLTVGLGLQEVGAADDLITVNQAKMGCGIIHGGDVFVLGREEPIRDDCADWGLRWAADRDQVDPGVALVVLGAWDAYDRRVDGTVVPFGTPQSDDLLLRDLQNAVDALARKGTKVVFTTVPYFEDQYVVNRPDEFKSAFDPPRVDHLNDLIRSVARANPTKVSVVDLNRHLSSDGQFHPTVGGQVLQDDGVHFGVEGRKIVAAWLAPQLRAIARA